MKRADGLPEQREVKDLEMFAEDIEIAAMYVEFDPVFYFLYAPTQSAFPVIQFVDPDSFDRFDSIIEDSASALACIRYLKAAGVPSFNDIKTNEAYAKLFLAKLQQGAKPDQARHDALNSLPSTDFAS